MPYQHFSIWDKELEVFFDNLKEGEFSQVAAWEKWFYETGTYLIHKYEVRTLVLYTKEFVAKNRRYPDMSGLGLAGYMANVLQQIRDEFLLGATDLSEDGRFTLEAEFALLIDAALTNHKEFYDWRADLNSVKLTEYLAVTEKRNINQTAFVEDAIAKALENAEISDKLRADLEHFRIYIREINANVTPVTKMRGVFIEKSDSQEKRVSPQTSPTLANMSPRRDSRKGLQGSFKDPTAGGSPLSIHRTLYSNKAAASSRSTSEDKNHDKEQTSVELSLQRAMGLKSSN